MQTEIFKVTPKQRPQIVIMNLSNLTGVLNHAIEIGPKQYKPLRIDYKALLSFITGGFAPLRAVAISQRDPQVHRDMTAHDKFLRGLSNFGWTPVSTYFDSQTRDTQSIEQAIYNAVYHGHTETDPETGLERLVEGFNPADIDLTFVSGTNLWEPIITQYHDDGGFNCRVAFPSAALHPSYDRWPFLALDTFLDEQKERMAQREMKNKA